MWLAKDNGGRLCAGGRYQLYRTSKYACDVTIWIMQKENQSRFSRYSPPAASRCRWKMCPGVDVCVCRCERTKSLGWLGHSIWDSNHMFWFKIYVYTIIMLYGWRLMRQCHYLTYEWVIIIIMGHRNRPIRQYAPSASSPTTDIDNTQHGTNLFDILRTHQFTLC